MKVIVIGRSFYDEKGNCLLLKDLKNKTVEIFYVHIIDDSKIHANELASISNPILFQSLANCTHSGYYFLNSYSFYFYNGLMCLSPISFNGLPLASILNSNYKGEWNFYVFYNFLSFYIKILTFLLGCLFLLLKIFI